MSSNLAVLIEAKRLIRTLGERISLPLKAKILSQTSVYSLGSFYMFSTLIKSISETQLNLQKATKGKAQVVFNEMEVLSKHLFLHSPIKLFFRVLESAEYQNDDPYSLFCNSIFDVSLFFNESSVFEIAQHVEMLAAHIKNITKDKTFCKKKK